MPQGRICGLPAKPVRHREAMKHLGMPVVFPQGEASPQEQCLHLPAACRPRRLWWGQWVRAGTREGARQPVSLGSALRGCHGGNCYRGRGWGVAGPAAHHARHSLCSFLSLFLLDVGGLSQACHRMGYEAGSRLGARYVES